MHESLTLEYAWNTLNGIQKLFLMVGNSTPVTV